MKFLIFILLVVCSLSSCAKREISRPVSYPTFWHVETKWIAPFVQMTEYDMSSAPNRDRVLIEWFSPEGKVVRRLSGNKHQELSYRYHNSIQEKRGDNYLHHGVWGDWTVSHTASTFIATHNNRYAFAYNSRYEESTIDLYIDGIKQATLGPYDRMVLFWQNQKGLVQLTVSDSETDSSLALVYAGDGTELLRIPCSNNTSVMAATEEAVLLKRYGIRPEEKNQQPPFQYLKRDGFRSAVDQRDYPRFLAWGRETDTALFENSDSSLVLLDLSTGRPVWCCERCKNIREIQLLDDYAIALCFQYHQIRDYDRPGDRKSILGPLLYAVDLKSGSAMGMCRIANWTPTMGPPNGASLFPGGHTLYYLDEQRFQQIRAWDIEMCYGWERTWAWTAAEVDTWVLIFRSLIESGRWSAADQDTIYLSLESGCGSYDPMPEFYERISDLTGNVMPASMCPRDTSVRHIGFWRKPSFSNPVFMTTIGDPLHGRGEFEYHGDIISSEGKPLVSWH